jgi:hypothetical protein
MCIYSAEGRLGKIYTADLLLPLYITSLRLTHVPEVIAEINKIPASLLFYNIPSSIAALNAIRSLYTGIMFLPSSTPTM